MIIHSKAEDFLASLTVGSVDLVCMDPPYFGIVEEKWDKQWTDANEYVRWFSEILRLCNRVLASHGTLIFFGGMGRHGEHPLFRLVLAAEEFFFFRDWITWKKRRAIGKDNRYLYCREEIIFMTKSHEQTGFVFNVPLTNELRGYDGFNEKYAAKSPYKRVSNVWDDIPEIMRPRRRCEKPVPLLERLILTHSNAGQLVVDPFSGTGVTGVACKRRDRRFSGSDIDDIWVKKGNADIQATQTVPTGTPIETLSKQLSKSKGHAKTNK